MQNHKLTADTPRASYSNWLVKLRNRGMCKFRPTQLTSDKDSNGKSRNPLNKWDWKWEKTSINGECSECSIAMPYQKKTSAIGACCIRPFRSESGSPAEKSPIFFRPKSDSAFGFFFGSGKILLLSDTTDS